jgi:hypothetical protein
MEPGEVIDYNIGYREGQKTAQEDPYLTKEMLVNVATRRHVEINKHLIVDWKTFLAGMKQGFHDEKEGLAHPLKGEQGGYYASYGLEAL